LKVRIGAHHSLVRSSSGPEYEYEYEYEYEHHDEVGP